MSRHIASGVLCAGLLAGMIGGGLLAGPALASTTTVTRLAGADRYATAVQVSRSSFTPFASGKGTVYLAAGTNFPDALGLGALAAEAGAPVLLTAPTSLPTSVAQELKRLHPATVKIVGGPVAVSQSVQNAVSALSFSHSTRRIAGADRWATNRALIKDHFGSAHVSTVYLAAGTNFPDSLAAGPAAASVNGAVVLINGSAPSLDTSTLNLLTSLGVTNVRIAGGTAAISAGIENQVKTKLGASHVTRYAGADRYQTAALIDRAAWTTSQAKVIVASGENFPDALSAGALGKPLLTTPASGIPAGTLSEIQALNPSAIDLIGGTSALPSKVQTQLTPARFTSTPKPSITGTPSVGNVLTAVTGTWTPTPTTLAYQWNRNGVAIGGATGRTYTVSSADSGHTITVKVTASKKGYATTSVTSAATSAVTSSSAGTLSLVAGVVPQDLPAQATLVDVYPNAIASDSAGSLYIADANSYAVERLDADGQLNVVAYAYGASGIVVDPAGDVYFSASNQVMKVTPSGDETVVAGNGSEGSPNPGPAAASSLRYPGGLALDHAGNLYIADSGNNRVEKVTPSGQLSIVAGDGQADTPRAGTATSSPLNNPMGVAVDGAGNLYIADTDNYVVEKVTPSGQLAVIAGNGTTEAAPTQPGPATSTSIGTVTGIVLDASGNLLVSAGGYGGYVDKIIPSGTLSVLAGTGTVGLPTPGPVASSPLGGILQGVALDASGGFYLADTSNGVVDEVSASGTLSIVAGLNPNPKPGPAAQSGFINPQGVAVGPDGSTYVADSNYVEKLSPTGVLSLFAGNGQTDSIYTGNQGGAPTPGPARDTTLNQANGVAVDHSGNVFVASNGYVEKITAAGTLSVVAGGGYDSPATGMHATDANFGTISDVAVDSSGNLYLADPSNNLIEKVNSSGVLTVLAGDGTSDDPKAGPATSSPVGNPQSIAVDGSGNVFVTLWNQYLLKISLAGALTIVAHQSNVGYGAPIAVDGSGNLYVGDDGQVSKLSSSGNLLAAYGISVNAAPTFGPVENSSLSGASGLATDGAGNLYIANSRHFIEKVTWN